MARPQLGSLLVATVVGVASGYYIFQPMIEQSMRDMQVKQMRDAPIPNERPLPAETSK